jgi:GAF domain-containing protein
VSLREALRPIAKSIADMQTLMSEGDRRAKAETIAVQCADKLKLVMHEVPNFRSVVYRRNEAGDTLSVVTFAGRSETLAPEDFSKDDPRGKAAFATLKCKAPIFVRDVTDADEVAKLNATLPGVVYEGPRAGYKTFIAAPVVVGQSEYGMITVDAAEPGDLLGSEKYLVQLFADMLAIAVASIRETPTTEAAAKKGVAKDG